MYISEMIEQLPKSVIDRYKLTTYYKKESYIVENFDKYYIDKIKVFHGSYNNQLRPTYNLGRLVNDYGRGFYTTFEAEQGKEWAHTDELESGYLYEVTIDISDLTIYNFNNHSVLEWYAELLSHRKHELRGYNLELIDDFIKTYKPNITEDIIYGWRADASFYTITKYFLGGQLTIETLDKALRIGDMGYQLVLHTPKAFNNIILCENKGKVDHSYYDKYVQHNSDALNSLHDLLKKRAGSNTISTVLWGKSYD